MMRRLRRDGWPALALAGCFRLGCLLRRRLRLLNMPNMVTPCRDGWGWVMTVPATELRPHAVGGVVYNDVVSRTLFVRLPDAASGHDRSLWRQAYQRLVAAEQAGWPPSAPWVWVH